MKITSIKQQVKAADRYSVFVDGKYAFSLSETGLLESKLASGQELDAPQLAALKKTAGIDKAYNNALRYVTIRPRSTWEIQIYLQRKGASAPATEQIIARLHKNNLLNDADFAKTWVANRRLLKPVSKRRLVVELKQKRIAEDIIGQVLHEDTADEKAVLRQLIERKQSLSRYQDKTKFMRYLISQGFSFDDVKTCLDDPS